ncbi:MAG: hypothetical protein KatS3mg007_1863 [Thermoanaerobaculum sp.]|nr:MAG: hypothetical protein KatS3mg007_1863 [Thermoanaerobaculum sp.]
MTNARRVSTILSAASLLALVCAGSGRAMAAELHYGANLGTATGTFGLSQRTTLAVFEPFVTAEKPNLRLTGYFPIVYRSTPFVTRAGSMHFGSSDHRWSGGMGHGSHHGHHGQGHVPDPSTIRFRRTGLADPLIRVDLLSVGARWVSGVGTFLAVKPPIASSKEGFSTGAWDVGAGVTVVRGFAGLDMAGELAYWSLGDGPFIRLHDIVAADLAVGTPLVWGPLTIAATVHATSTAVPGRGAPVELGVAASRGFPGTEPVLAVRFGVTRAAPRFSVFLTWTGWR